MWEGQETGGEGKAGAPTDKILIDSSVCIGSEARIFLVNNKLLRLNCAH